VSGCEAQNEVENEVENEVGANRRTNRRVTRRTNSSRLFLDDCSMSHSLVVENGGMRHLDELADANQ
jgi:very-short-patch-repair endonuclease